jgi:peptidoglycan/xylan/chitin deacetylase (PgdA/CDA1 family)
MGIVFNFHDVSDLHWFENIICFINQKNSFVHLSEFISSYKGGNGQKIPGHVTVDDGDKTFYNVIFPVLKKHKIPATIFVSPEIAINQKNFWFQEIVGYDEQKLLDVSSEVVGIGASDLKRFPVLHILKCLTIEQIWEIIDRYKNKHQPGEKLCQNMSVNEIREVENSGLVTIGAHTLRHPVLANEILEVSKNEIISSFIGLSEILGHEIDCFAYPNGEPILDFGQREMGILKDIGCKYAFSTRAGSFNSGTSLLSIPRYGSSTGESNYYLRIKVLLGSNWNRIMRFKPGNEFVNRKSLTQLIREKQSQ